VNLAVIEPAVASSMYHWETETEAFFRDLGRGDSS
jgi:hypothetical protein